MAAPCPFCPKTRTSTYGRSNSAFPDRTIVGKPRLEAVWPLVHGGQRLMAWAVSNARVEPRGNAIVITKQASGTAKIDPLMAALNAVAWMSANPASSQPSIFVI